jgi:hypothetical protein
MLGFVSFNSLFGDADLPHHSDGVSRQYGRIIHTMA